MWWKIINICDLIFCLGNYKVQLYDPRTGGFMPSSPGIGMHVEVKDPEDKTILSRVSKMSLALS
jgi:p24 family protein alpha